MISYWPQEIKYSTLGTVITIYMRGKKAERNVQERKIQSKVGGEVRIPVQ